MSSHLQTASLYGKALIAELAQVDGETSPDLASLFETSLSLSSELPRIILASQPDPGLMLLLIRRLIEAHQVIQDPFVEREMRRRKCVIFGWYRANLRLWFMAAMRRRAGRMWDRGEWGQAGELAMDYARLGYCFTRLWTTGFALRMGLRVTIDGPANDLLAAFAPYCATE